MLSEDSSVISSREELHLIPEVTAVEEVIAEVEALHLLEDTAEVDNNNLADTTEVGSSSNNSVAVEEILSTRWTV